jgi:hypothetical protein
MRPVRNEVDSLVVVVRVGSLSGIGEIFGKTVHCRERERERYFRNGFGKCTSFESVRERERMADLQRDRWCGVVLFCERGFKEGKYVLLFFLCV